MSIETEPRTTLSAKEVTRLIDEAFPGIHAQGRSFSIESVAHHAACVRIAPTPGAIRPGGTISGPALFSLADVAIYAALIATLSPSQ
jgi:acyl-coenzyme A thioesterase PaaI-like protein